MGQGDDEDDAEKMRLAFQQFMLTGKKASDDDVRPAGSSLSASTAAATSSKKKKKNKKGKKRHSSSPVLATPPTKSSFQLTPTPSSQGKLAKTDKKRYYNLLRSFIGKVKTWMDTDDQILAVLDNIVSIRRRLPLEWKLKLSLRSSSECDDGWKYHGLSGRPKEASYATVHLLPEDADLALSHDLEQHEKMLAGLRKLMSDLSDSIEAMGRALDTLLKFHLECEFDYDGEDGVEAETIVQSVIDLFHMLSLELYRKQALLVPTIFDSTTDDMLGLSDGRKRLESSAGGVEIARRCWQAWKRDCDESCFDQQVFDHATGLDTRMASPLSA